MNRSRKRLNCETGASLLEVAMIASILIGIFVVAAIALDLSFRELADNSMDNVERAVPCNTGWLNDTGPTSECQ